MHEKNKELVHWISIGIAGIIALILVFAHIIPKMRELNPLSEFSLNTLVTLGIVVSMIFVSISSLYVVWGLGRKVKLWGQV
ncbi:MAG: hypothetical protein HZR80_02210 [Candidatus Heimdallarchaeota archaeon]